jgi:hypothetical protein
MLATVSVLSLGDRLWSADGLTATVTGIDGRGLLARVDGERVPVPMRLGSWRRALFCDRCETAAEWAVRLPDGEAELLCERCAHAWAAGPAAWSHPIPRTLIREIYTRCAHLG